MRNLFNKNLVFCCFLLILAAGCKKTKDPLPEREKSPEVAELAKTYTDILAAAPDGWVLAYKPDPRADSIFIHLRFGQEEVNMLAGIRGFHGSYDTTAFGFEGKYTPVIAFSENSVFGAIESEYNGFHKFKIDFRDEDQVFALKRSDGYDDRVIELKKASPSLRAPLQTQIDSILADIAYEEEQERILRAVIEKFGTFASFESDYYFYNLRTDGFSGAISALDTAQRKMTITYKPVPTSAPVQASLSYSFYQEGIVLSPAISFANVRIDTLELGQLEHPHLEVLRAGNTGSGIMGFMHEAPYVYTLSTDRTRSLADYFMNVYPSYLQSSGRLSDPAMTYSEELRNYVETNTTYSGTDRWLFFIYAPKYPTASIASSFYVGARKADGAVGNFRYDVDIDGLGGNKLVMNRLTRQVVPSPVTEPDLNIQSVVQGFMDQVYPESGILAIPYNMAQEGGAGSRIRFVNSEDSRIWVEYRWLDASYWNLIFD